MKNQKRLAIEFGAITKDNIEQLRKLNTSCFPVSYSDNFYREMVQRGKENENLCKYAYYHGFVIGAICTRIEPIPTDGDSSSSKKRIYIMTLGVLAAYRGYGVGQQLVQSVLDYYEQSRSVVNHSPDMHDVEEIVLHVHTANKDGIRFYIEKFGFQQGELIKNYYTQKIDPPDCYILYKKL